MLRGFAAARPSVGYCQGLNFLAGTLLLFQKQELALASLLQLVVSTDKNKGKRLRESQGPLFRLPAPPDDTGPISEPPDTLLRCFCTTHALEIALTVAPGLQIGQYYSNGMIDLRRDLKVLELLIRQKSPRVFQVLKSA